MEITVSLIVKAGSFDLSAIEAAFEKYTEKHEMEIEFDKVDKCGNHYVVSIADSNGSEPSYLDVAKYLDKALSSEIHVSGVGEEFYLFFVRKDRGTKSYLLKVWEEEDPEVLLEYQDWFNDGLPEALQVHYL